MKSGNIILFVLCGIAFAAGMAIYLEASAFQKTSEVALGTVANTSLSSFEIKYISGDGIERTYSGKHGGKGRKYHDGEKVKVFYQVDNPDKCRISDGVKGGKRVIFWSFILLLFNLFSIYNGRKKERSDKHFKTTGRRVEAQILKTDVDTTITVLKKNPYYIDCKWTDPITGREYAHTIRYIWTDPKTLLDGPSKIDVYIDRDDPEKYYMDIKFLGESAK